MNRRLACLIATVPLIVLVLLVGLAQPRPLVDLRNLVFDTYQRTKPRLYDPTLPVVIVDIDEASLRRLGQWPWPRTFVSDLIVRVIDMGAATVALDLVFAEPDRLSPEQLIATLPPGEMRDSLAATLSAVEPNDRVLARRITGVPVVLATVLTPTGAHDSQPRKAGIVIAGDDPRPFMPRFSRVTRPLDELSAAAAGLGAINWNPDDDQTVRRVPMVLTLGDTIVPGLAAETLRVAQGASTIILRASNASGAMDFGARTGLSAIRIGAFEIPVGAAGDVRVHYTKTDRRRFVSAADVMAGRLPRDAFDGRIVLVGTSAPGLMDLRATPVDPVVPGVEVHAQTIESILTRDMLVRPDWAIGAEVVAAVAVAALIALILPLGPALWGALAGAALIGGLGLASWWLHARHGLLLDASFPALSAAAVQASGLVALYRTEQRQKAQVRAAFGRFVAPTVVDRLAENPDALTLGGELRTLTVMFSDLRDFTRISEQYDAAGLANFMNEYLTPMTDIVLDHAGTVDKFIGDAVMAFWNAPLDVTDHAGKAARAALAMTDRLARLNMEWAARAEREGRPHVPVTAGFGLATGPCSVGNMGSSRRFDYSALGDDVNLASRLEAATRFYKVAILASQATRDAAPDLAWIEVDTVRVKGKLRPTRLYTLLGDTRLAASADFRSLADTVSAIHERTRTHNFAGARHACRDLRTTLPAELAAYLTSLEERLDALIASPPNADWDGIRVFETK
jgi:adenylate cyclase